ncbi:hypothetical protein SAMN05428957_10771 [Oryzisolibacter propanilivorax]|uniref:Uncharacterized protein n=1 Tax=Oryzisolibacter propanilivorax TaxID=1527607 RepID=A0A1G9TYP4_9BURK|nr:hypothetical protein [Oryzisolibacter propanilivorax]SDM52703.1 hypothetical protein SAMN05428957_10771 [Oryzisolibacter propanilivorax]
MPGRALDLLAIAQAAARYSAAVVDTRQRQQDLSDGYAAWRQRMGHFDDIERASPAWHAMLAATAEQYRQLQNARGRQRRAQARLLRLAQPEV